MSFHVGIDPGKVVGFALWDAKLQQYLSLQSQNIWQTFKLIEHFGSMYNLHSIQIENPGLNKPVFMAKDQKNEMEKAFEEMNEFARRNEAGFNNAVLTIESQIRIFAAKAQRVGMNKQYASFLIEWCQMQNYKVIEVRPYLKKLNHEEFCELTGWKQRTNEHVRDAARLVYGIKPVLE